MTKTLDLSEAVMQRLTDQAVRRGISFEAVVIEILERGLQEVEFENEVHDIREEIWLEKQGVFIRTREGSGTA